MDQKGRTAIGAPADFERKRKTIETHVAGRARQCLVKMVNRGCR